MPSRVVLHLVSHASGELVEMLARNAVAQLVDVETERHTWKFVRSIGQLPDILARVAAHPGFVFHSVAAADVREALEAGCQRLRQPCAFVLEPFVTRLAGHARVEVRYRSSHSDVIDEEYYRRVEAMKYAIAHDDGLAADELDDADIILLGVSRATKTPTCMYLASRGLKAANVPLVPGVPLPEGVLRACGPLIVGLTVDPRRLSRVRADRIDGLGGAEAGAYSDLDAVTTEIREARRLFARYGWPSVDVTDRSIEHTAALIIDLLHKQRGEPPP